MSSAILIPSIIYRISSMQKMWDKAETVGAMCTLPLKNEKISTLYEDIDKLNNCEKFRCFCLKKENCNLDVSLKYFNDFVGINPPKMCYYFKASWGYTLYSIYPDIADIRRKKTEILKEELVNEYSKLSLNEATAFNIYVNSRKDIKYEGKHSESIQNRFYNNYFPLARKLKKDVVCHDFLQCAFCFSFDLLLQVADGINLVEKRFITMFNNSTGDEKKSWLIFLQSLSILKDKLTNVNEDKVIITLKKLCSFNRMLCNNATSLADLAELPIFAAIVLSVYDFYCDLSDGTYGSNGNKFNDIFFTVGSLEESLLSLQTKLKHFFECEDISKL